jgi:hypothetical protein
VRNVVVFVAVLLMTAFALEGQTPTIFKGKPALEFVSGEGTARIVLGLDQNGYPALVFSVAHFHVIGECYGPLSVSYNVVQFVGSGDHHFDLARRELGKDWSKEWSKDKKGRDCMTIKRGGQTYRLAVAVTDAKGKPVCPVVLTGELSKLRTWLNDAIDNFEDTYFQFRKLTERVH